MIDIENEVFDRCARLLIAEFPSITVSSMNVNAPASFPAAYISEVDSSTNSLMNDSSDGENASVVQYEVIVYSNKRTGSKSEAKKMFGIVNDCLTSINFNRTFRTQGTMPTDGSIYRITARFIATVDKNGKIYRR